MSFYFIKTPKIIQRFFKNYVWSFSIDSSKQKTTYLTFDDGPTPEITEWILNTLNKYNAKATFFCIGKNVKSHPEIFQKIINDKHSIGNHTHNHLNGWKTNSKDFIENILLAEENLQPTTTNQQPSTKLFRPPYGKIKPSQAKQLIKKGYKIIMWDVLSADFDQSISKEKCLENVLKNTQNGSIIVFHDSIKAKNNLKFVLPKVLEHFQKKGYQFNSIALPN
ncbi:MAG: polysaccharide deacetylase family protein [Flavobacteriaceae bacterium]